MADPDTDLRDRLNLSYQEVREKFFAAMQRDPLVRGVYQMFVHGTLKSWEEMLTTLCVNLWEANCRMEATILKGLEHAQ